MSDRAVVKGHLIRRTIQLAVPRERVWAALTEPELLIQWFGEGFEVTSFEVGGTGRIIYEDFGDFPFEITEIAPQQTLAFRWSGIPADELDEYSTVVTFTLAGDESSSELTVVESGFESIPGGTRYRRDRLEQNREGWDVELDELAALLQS
ncbi:uncharacterized protein YndB with AHSA1/START domain [Conyzicola nivalis]|uniref:Uncharacterized protein YndB with AHSA1/START domain n=1 Tax=Conyzicola nivalis TaxID=1477021 RepID=A0ABV2QRP3_9MICO